MTTVADFTSQYSMRAALRQAGFPEHAIASAMHALFPTPPSDRDFEEAMQRADAQEAIDRERSYDPELYS